MMQNLRLILIIISSSAIIALLFHVFWINRKKHSQLFRDCLNEHLRYKDKEIIFDEDTKEICMVASVSCQTNPILLATTSENLQQIKKNLVSMPTILTNENNLIIPPIPQTMTIPLVLTNETKQETEVEKKIKTKPEISTKTVLILNVVAYPSGLITGQQLLKSIHQAGFRFGKMDIFHYYFDSSSNYAILFSLVNMVKPGFFDLVNITNFTTPGISLFMVIPSYGDAYQNFKLMLQSAQRIADDLGGIVQDDEHHIITPQKLEIYKVRIRQVLDVIS